MHSCCPPAFPLPFVRAARSQVKVVSPCGGQESGVVCLTMRIQMLLAPGVRIVSRAHVDPRNRTRHRTPTRPRSSRSRRASLRPCRTTYVLSLVGFIPCFSSLPTVPVFEGLLLQKDALLRASRARRCTGGFVASFFRNHTLLQEWLHGVITARGV